MAAPLLTPARASDILAGIREGLFPAVAAQRAGISRDTLRRWRARGEREQRGSYHDFVVALGRAEAEVEATVLRQVMQSAQSGDARIALAYLERRFQDRWQSRRPRVPIDTAGSAGLADQGRAIVQAMVAGEIAPNEARESLGALVELVKVVEATEVLSKLAALEQRVAELVKGKLE